MAELLRPYKTFDYDLGGLLLKNFKGDSIDIMPQLSIMVLEESLLQPFCVGAITLNDSIDLAQYFPLIGGETIEIRYRSKNTEEWATREFYVNKLFDRVRVKNSYGYSLQLISIEFINSITNKKYRNFKQQKICSIVKTLFKEISDKNIDVVSCSNDTSFLTSGLSASDSIINLCKIAKSDKYNGYSYVFYEDAEKFNFKPIEHLYLQDKDISYTFYPQSEIELQPELAIYSIREFTIHRDFSEVDNIQNGIYGSSMLTVDPMTRSFGVSKYEYADTFKQLQHSEKETPLEIKTSNFYEREYSSSVWNSTLSTKGRKKSKYIESHCSKYNTICPFSTKENSKLLRDYQIYSCFSNFIIEIEVSGNSELRAGDIISLKIPSQNLLDRSASVSHFEDRFLSGKYIATKITHTFSNNNMVTNIQLSKDSYSYDHEDAEFLNLASEFFNYANR